MPGPLPFSLTLLVPMVGLGYSGRGAASALRTAGFHFGDHPFREAWREAAAYKKGEWAASQLPEDIYPPERFGRTSPNLRREERLLTFTTLEYNPRTGEYRTGHTARTFDADVTIEEAKMGVRATWPETATDTTPWLVQRMSFVAQWRGE